MSKLILASATLALMVGCGGSATAGGGRGTTVASMDANRVSVSIHNGSSQVVCYLRISPVSDPNWGPDQLGSHVLNPGDSYVTAIPTGGWDFRAEDCSHNEVGVLRNFPVVENAVLEVR